eukprot:CAMPEP_0202962276 /NCGR_PEP_ID=MMETSP1396-20130829/6368_1 /ASSEMBLY_ACC=CAM_ASM_000872 /TAXON_ID= /ORGANISM="Pseudokeronopsis sp., Strain Brazil" /LENGTH=56 /DNA_ID=CAMNT_0049682727 /DNA_START=2029 /DNA_END=2199 /DNA_ORIENTATION=+
MLKNFELDVNLSAMLPDEKGKSKTKSPLMKKMSPVIVEKDIDSSLAPMKQENNATE